MTPKLFLEMSPDTHSALWAHLLPEPFLLEEAAFAYTRVESAEGAWVFTVIDWQPVPPEGFVYQTEIGFELTDDMRSIVIKRAHDLEASLVELHSHTGPWPAKFSPSDRYGFSEFVPHVWWRLKGRPYLSVVVTRSGFDAFAWTTDAVTAQRLNSIRVGGTLIESTKLSPLTASEYYD